MQRVHDPQPASSARRRLEPGRGDERAEHDPRPVPPRDQHRVLAVEADAGSGRRLTVDVLVRVDEHAVRRAERVPECVEPLAQHRVAVPPRVPRQPAVAGRDRALGAVVAERRRDDAARAVEQPLRMTRHLGVRRREAQPPEQPARAPGADVGLRPAVGAAGVTPTASSPSSCPAVSRRRLSRISLLHWTPDVFGFALASAREGDQAPRGGRPGGAALRGRPRSRARPGRGARGAAGGLAEPPGPVAPPGAALGREAAHPRRRRRRRARRDGRARRDRPGLARRRVAMRRSASTATAPTPS